jgi:uncharacterized repeat protein (TIGR03803 family)
LKYTLIGVAVGIGALCWRRAEHMRISDLGCFALGVFAAAMLAGCGRGIGTPLSPSPAGVPADRMHARPAYAVRHSFKGGTDGALPRAGLINVKGKLYGTTEVGGASGYGTVFSLSP